MALVHIYKIGCLVKLTRSASIDNFTLGLGRRQASQRFLAKKGLPQTGSGASPGQVKWFVKGGRNVQTYVSSRPIHPDQKNPTWRTVNSLLLFNWFTLLY